jgi:hypothetical protein
MLHLTVEVMVQDGYLHEAAVPATHESEDDCFREVTFSASENATGRRLARRGRAPVELDEGFVDVLDGYVAALVAAPLSAQSRRTYASKVRQFLVWLAGAEVDGDPLGSADGRDWTVRDYRGYLQSVLKRSPATVNGALAAVDDFLRAPRTWAGQGEARGGAGGGAARARSEGADPVSAGSAGVWLGAGSGARVGAVLRRRADRGGGRA